MPPKRCKNVLKLIRAGTNKAWKLMQKIVALESHPEFRPACFPFFLSNRFAWSLQLLWRTTLSRWVTVSVTVLFLHPAAQLSSPGLVLSGICSHLVLFGLIWSQLVAASHGTGALKSARKFTRPGPVLGPQPEERCPPAAPSIAPSQLPPRGSGPEWGARQHSCGPVPLPASAHLWPQFYGGRWVAVRKNIPWVNTWMYIWYVKNYIICLIYVKCSHGSISTQLSRSLCCCRLEPFRCGAYANWIYWIWMSKCDTMHCWHLTNLILCHIFGISYLLNHNQETASITSVVFAGIL